MFEEAMLFFDSDDTFYKEDRALTLLRQGAFFTSIADSLPVMGYAYDSDADAENLQGPSEEEMEEAMRKFKGRSNQAANKALKILMEKRPEFGEDGSFSLSDVKKMAMIMSR